MNNLIPLTKLKKGNIYCFVLGNQEDDPFYLIDIQHKKDIITTIRLEKNRISISDYQSFACLLYRKFNE